jgi:hypothetical protein
MNKCTATTKNGSQCTSYAKHGEQVCGKHMIYQTELTFVGEPFDKYVIPSFIKKSPYGKWQDIVIDKTRGNNIGTRHALTENKPNVFWTVWNIGDYTTLSSKYPDLSSFRKHFEMELTSMKEHCQCVLVYNTEKHPFKDDPYLDIIEEISIRLKVYLFHIPFNVLYYLQFFTRTNRDDLFYSSVPKGASVSFRHGSPHLRYQQKRGENNKWDIFSKDSTYAQYYQ